MSGRPETADTYPFMIRHCKRSVAQRVQASAAARGMTVPNYLEKVVDFLDEARDGISRDAPVDFPSLLLTQYGLGPTNS